MKQQESNPSGGPWVATPPRAEPSQPPVDHQASDYTDLATGASPILVAMAETLDSLGMAMCVFDENDRMLLWNRSFLHIFPEQRGRLRAGDGYRDALRRFYEVRLTSEELPFIDRYLDEGVARHQTQQRPISFDHRGLRLTVASLPLPGVGRVRMWQTPVPSPVLDGASHPAALADGAAHAAVIEGLDALPINGAALFDQVADGVMVTGPDDRIAWANDPFIQMYGLGDRAGAIGKRFEDAYRSAWQAVDGSQRALFDRGLATLTEHMRFAGAPFELPLPGARWSRVVEQRSPDGKGFFVHVDITVLKRQQQQLLRAERRARESEQVLKEKSALLEATLERMEQGVMMINADGVVEVCNRRARELLELPQALMDSRPTLNALADHQLAQGEFESAPPELAAQVRVGGIFNQAYSYDRKRPNGRVVEVSSVPTESGGVLRTYTDITERKRAEERIRHIARHDGLTSLVNREVFLEYLTAALCDPVRRAEGFAVHFIDIDQFKPINDRCGHAIGDKVLALVAERMRLIARDVDVVARMGGDEFAVLQYQVDQHEGALGLATRLRDGVASAMEIEGHRLRVGASVGIALYHATDVQAELAEDRGQAQTADTLLRHADTAMYAAKAEGGVRVFGLDGLDSAWAPVS
jgi:diguanylate cyclase (GGDEF)-like protein